MNVTKITSDSVGSEFKSSPPPLDLLSVIIPARNSERALRLCLTALGKSSLRPLEIIVVDDASTEPLGNAAEAMGAQVIRLSSQVGPARARNVGAEAARGQVLVFVDSDVCVHPNALALIAADLTNDPKLAAVFGCYDNSPAETDFISYFKTLQHHFFHQTGPAKVCTFWSGCGAMRRDIFLAAGGFNADYRRPSIEDIELGTRLARAGYAIRLNREIQVKHLKKWTLGQVIRTDILDRAVPWTGVLLRYKEFPSVLNLEVKQRISVLLSLIFTASFLCGCLILGLPFGAPFLYLALVVLGTYLVGWFTTARGVGPFLYGLVLFALVGWTAHLSHTTYLLVLVSIEYVALVVRRLFPPRQESLSHKVAVASGVYAAVVFLVIIPYIPKHWTSLAMAITGVGVLHLNREFYLLLARLWGRQHAVSAIPFHFLYQLSCAVGMAVGIVWFYLRLMVSGRRRESGKDRLGHISVLNVELSKPHSGPQ